MSIDDVRGALKSAPSVAAAPTVAYAGAPATLKNGMIEFVSTAPKGLINDDENNPEKASRTTDISPTTIS